MNETQVGYAFIAFICIVSVIGLTSIICSIIFDREPCHDYKFVPPSYQKNQLSSFDMDDNNDSILLNDSYLGDSFDE